MKKTWTPTSLSLILITVSVLLSPPGVRGGLVISSAVEMNGEPTGIAITGDVIADHADPNVPDPYTVLTFGEDVVSYTDRDHEYNGVTAAGLPGFLIGGDYIMTANNARDNAGYVLDVTTVVTANLYLLRDKRSDGSLPAWFSDGVGLDFTYTGVDVGADEDGVAIGTVGPGVGINQSFSVFLANDPNNGGNAALPAGTYQLLASETAGQGMYGVVAVGADVNVPIREFSVSPLTILAGETTTLSWLISSNATSAVITPDVGDILPFTDAVGAGATNITPVVTTTYTLTVQSPGGNNAADATVGVQLIESFGSDTQLVTPGDAVMLSWQVRTDADVSIDGIGDVSAFTDASGNGSLMVNPEETITYVLRASGSGGAELEQASTSVYVTQVEGALVGLIDIGATDGTADPEALNGAQVGAGPNQSNGANLSPFSLTTIQGDPITVTVDNLDPNGVPTGGIDWRWRGAAPNDAINHTLEDLCKNNAGMIRVTLSGLPAGEYTATSFHFDPTQSQCEAIDILVSDVRRTAVSVSPPFGTAVSNPVILANQLTTDFAETYGVTHSFGADGLGDIIFYYDGRAAIDTEVPLNGLVLVRTGDLVVEEPIVGFAAVPSVISFGESSELSWFISPTATTGSIDQAIGDILPATEVDGMGSLTVMPAVTTTYMLSVTTPGSNDTAVATVVVRLIDTFDSSAVLINRGEPVTLNWVVRPDATVSISGLGDVTSITSSNGVGSVEVFPTVSTVYTLNAVAGAEMEEATIRVRVLPIGERFALIDIGQNTGRPESGSAMDTFGNQQIGNSGNGNSLTTTSMIGGGGETFTMTIDAIDPAGTAVGGIDWRDRGDPTNTPLNLLVEDFVKNNGGILRVVLGGLPAGAFDIVSYHMDYDNSQCEDIRVLVTDADGVAVERSGIGDASFPGHPTNSGVPGIGGLTKAVVLEHFNSFAVRSDGVSDVTIYFDGRNAPLDTELPLNGLEIHYEAVDRPRIFNVQFDPSTGNFSFDFNAETGAVYAVESGADLHAFPEMTDTLISADEPVEHVVVPNVSPSVEQRHYRIRLETPAP